MRMPVTNFDPTRIPHLLHTHMKGKGRSPKRIPHQNSKSSCWKMLICRKESLWQNSALRSQTSLERREPRRQASRITSTTNEKSLAKRRRTKSRASLRNSDTFPTPKRRRSPASKPTSLPSSFWITPTNGRGSFSMAWSRSCSPRATRRSFARANLTPRPSSCTSTRCSRWASMALSSSPRQTSKPCTTALDAPASRSSFSMRPSTAQAPAGSKPTSTTACTMPRRRFSMPATRTFSPLPPI